VEGIRLQSEWNRANIASLSFLFGMIGALFYVLVICHSANSAAKSTSATVSQRVKVNQNEKGELLCLKE